jgi:cytochrome c oxidase subunit 2
MSFVRRHAVPFAAGVAAATAAFAIIALTTDDGPEQRTPSGGEAAQRAEANPGDLAEANPGGLAEANPGGLAVFNRMGCGGCHELAAANSSGPIAPNLDERLPSHTRESLRVAILTPPAGGMMPEDFGRRLSETELEALIDFLLASSPR